MSIGEIGLVCIVKWACLIHTSQNNLQNKTQVSFGIFTFLTFAMQFYEKMALGVLFQLYDTMFLTTKCTKNVLMGKVWIKFKYSISENEAPCAMFREIAFQNVFIR